MSDGISSDVIMRYGYKQDEWSTVQIGTRWTESLFNRSKYTTRSSECVVRFGFVRREESRYIKFTEICVIVGEEEGGYGCRRCGEDEYK